MTWTAHPLARRPRDGMLALFVILLTAYAILANGEAWLAGLSAVFLAAAIGPFVFPTHYVLDDTGITSRRFWVTRTRPWSQLRRCDANTRYALVSPFAQRRFLDRYRGMVLLYDGGDRDQILATIHAHLR